MPGHVVKSTGPDPDPTEYLFVSVEQKMLDQTKPYDPKKACWVPDMEHGFVEGEIQQISGDLTTVTIKGGETKAFKTELVCQVNPPKYEKCEDMSNLTYLNDPSVLYNLKTRYQAKLIYTYSGLFCIAVNPYKRFPIYTNRTVKLYQGKRRNEVPPHLFAIADGAYMNMLQASQNQSMLITGESGAGKTENTKKVLSYFANVGATTKSKDAANKPNLEDQIIQTNPVLEAFGNAKTTRNDNSSRFGKFIRIHFAPNGKLSGADIEVYLLEKARVISQQAAERGYHIFYQLMSNQIKELKPLCSLSDDIYDYHYVSQGKVTVPSIDDAEDMQFTHEAFDVLNFSHDERDNCYKITATVMHMGQMKFKQRGREEQAEPDGTEAGNTVASLLGVDGDELYRNLCKPKIKVGAEFVTQGRNVSQVVYSMGALAKALFDRVFKWLVKKCNQTLETGQKRAMFIGVLDIAGFEIFDFNGFEQICINFCNEKLQQFFNHHMFVLEQEEYKKEGINWTFVDFGMDLQACIELFEKKLGILSILEEESMFPKATDKTFEEKLKANHLGKSPCFIKPKPPKPGETEGHFAVVHYAGTVTYNLSGWLEKNKDPLNDTVVDQLKKSSNALVTEIFADHPGQSGDAGSKGGKGGKGAASFKTVSSGYKDQLANLMKTLNATHPHFIRCIVPNETKSPGVVDAGLIMHQLTCNGVLEGIRICRKGFPNRMPYPDFRHRYKILASKEMSEIPDDKKAAEVCFQRAGLDGELYRCGNTKVFFRAGALGTLEEVRDDRLGKIFAWLQAWIRGFSSRVSYKKLQEQRSSLIVVQRSLRQYLQLRNWCWFRLWQNVKPLLNVTRVEDEMRALEEKAAEALEAFEQENKLRLELEAANIKILEEKNRLMLTLESVQGNVSDSMEIQTKMKKQNIKLENHIEELTEQLDNEENSRKQLLQEKKDIEQGIKQLKKEINTLETSVTQAEQDKAAKDHLIKNLNEEITRLEELINKINKEKKHLQESNQKIGEDLQCVEDKCNHLNMVKAKLEQSLDEMEDSMEHEKKLRAEVEKLRRKAEGDVKLTHEAIADLERSLKEIQEALGRKDKEISNLASKLEGEHGLVSKLQAKVKDQQCQLEELEEEAEQERQGRCRAEKSRNQLSREVDALKDRLEEAVSEATTQIEANKKREAELSRTRRELEDSRIQHESIITGMRKKQNEVVSEMSEQIDHLNKQKARAEKDKDNVKRELEDARSVMDSLSRDKANTEKMNKQLHHEIVELQGKLAESGRTITDYEVNKKKLNTEHTEVIRQLEEAGSEVAQLSKIKLSLANQLEDTKRIAEDGEKAHVALLAKVRNLEHDNASLREQYEEECDLKADLLRRMSKAQAETNMWRSKYETEGVARAEEIEAARLKVTARLEEAERQITFLNTKNTNLEKNKQRILEELEDMQIGVDQAHMMANAAEKKQRTFEKIIEEWKLKVDALSVELEASQKECRHYSTEHFRIKAMHEEKLEHLEAVRRENKSLSDQIKDLMDQVAEEGRSLQEAQKIARFLEGEKEELQAALEEGELALEQEENKVLRSQLELGQAREDFERKLQEKEEEFENARKGHQRAIDNMTSSLETEAKSKSEVTRSKNKVEAELRGAEDALLQANKTNSDFQKAMTKNQDEIKNLHARIEEEQRMTREYREKYSSAERRNNGLAGELEEARILLEQSDRGRRQAESELAEATESVTNLTSQTNNLSLAKKKVEAELQLLQAELEEKVSESNSSDERAKKAMLEAARMADELRAEQDHSQTQESLRKGLECSVKELQTRLDENESHSMVTGKKAVNKLEDRIRELESKLQHESSCHAEAQKNLRKCERRVKELSLHSEEGMKNQCQLQDLVDKLEQKVKGYKRQIEEAEEIAALNLAKYRKAQQELEETERRAMGNHHEVSVSEITSLVSL